MSELLTVVTPTIGDSCQRLAILFRELRQYTRLPFQQIVSDDGTSLDRDLFNQHKVCAQYGVKWTENPGPVYGVSFNLNHVFEKVQTPWAYLLEDGLRPSWGWLEVAEDFIRQIGSKEWHGRRVGMAGFSSLQDWILRMGGAIPSSLLIMQWWEQHRDCAADFMGGWNDGLWCWERVFEKVALESFSAGASALDGEPAMMRDNIVRSRAALNGLENPRDINFPWFKSATTDHWPKNRSAYCAWYPGAFMLVNMEAWRKVGRFRDGCTFFEGHLGVRMGRAGYLSLAVNSPPWLHCPSQGFRVSGAQKQPRLHLDTKDLFLGDFCYDNMDAPNIVANNVTPIDVQLRINHLLSHISLSAGKEWDQWKKQSS